MIAAIIVEYNPLHNGHIYHINKTKEILASIAPNQDNYVIAIMSGNFTERGDIAILNKYTRARHAILAGVDMVIELPAIYATSSAEYFANGAMQIASKIKNLGLICFGAECDDITTLYEIAKLTTSKEYDRLIKEYLNQGLSYPASSEKAIQNLSKIDPNSVFSPNNMLGIEYIKQATKLGIKAQLQAIKRVGGNYNESELNAQFNSAKSIRKAICDGNLNLDELKVPQYVFEDLIKSQVDYDKLFAIISSKSLDLNNVYEDSEGIINRIKKYSQTAKNYSELVDAAHTKRYTKSKIRRILLHIALNYGINDLCKIGKTNILAVKQDKRHLLSLIDFCGDEICLNQNVNANKIYNIVSNDKITNETMLIL